MQTAISLETEMPAAAVLRRLARYGLWLRPTDIEAATWIAQVAARTRRHPDTVAATLARNPADFVAAIRRQWYANILWYSRGIEVILERCTAAAPDDRLLDVLELHEPDSRPTVSLEMASTAPPDSVVLDGHEPVGVGALDAEAPATVAKRLGRVRGAKSERPSEPAPPPPGPRTVRGWPRLEAPGYMPAQTPFEVVVGLGTQAQQGVAGGELVLQAPAAVETIPLTIALIADGVDAPNGWSQSLTISVSDPTAAVARFSLIGRVPSNSEQLHLTTLEARYIRDGIIVGTASRPLVIGAPTVPELVAPSNLGMPWLAQPPVATPVDLTAGLPVDLTIELVKPDGNIANGNFSCWLRSRHPLSVASGPYSVSLGEDARTFAKSVIDEMRQYSGDAIVDNLLESFGDLVGEKLPAEAMTAIADVGRITSPAPPSVLIVSADPYVPWELARLPVAIDATRPPYLGAQVLLGRWLQDSTSRPREDGHPRPPAQPPAAMNVRHMAVMAGQYNLTSGLRALPEAEKEAQALATTYDAVPLPASRAALKRLLDAQLDHNFTAIGGADAVHFAGHGEFDPSRVDSSVLLLNDGRPLSSILFRSAKYGGPQQPLLFLNACMIGVGGQLLGDMGGFPGNCLKGGFGGIVGALWEVDDLTAHDVALEFWQRALPASGAAGEPVGAVLRDLRSNYQASNPVSSYLAYVYYGHPSLTLRRSS